MPSSSSKSSKPKPSEVASETKKYYTPLIKHEYANRWQTCSYICRQPLIDIQFEDRPPSVTPPVFCKHDAPLPDNMSYSMLTRTQTCPRVTRLT